MGKMNTGTGSAKAMPSNAADTQAMQAI